MHGPWGGSEKVAAFGGKQRARSRKRLHFANTGDEDARVRVEVRGRQKTNAMLSLGVSIPKARVLSWISGDFTEIRNNACEVSGL